jgi:hypothetical protein
MKKLLALTLALGLAASANAAISITSATFSYSQNFNTLGSSDGESYSWTDDSTISGWYWQSDGDDQPYIAEDGSSTTGSPYSFGDDGDSDRAMGNLGGGDNDNTAWGVVFHNNSGAAISEIQIEYTGEQWREASGTDDILKFSYKVSSTDVTSLEHTSGAVPTGWTGVSALDFTPPESGTAGARDGNDAAYRESFDQTLNITLAANDYIAFRWYDADSAGIDNAVASDDFSLTVIPEPATAGLLGLGALALTLVRRRLRK